MVAAADAKLPKNKKRPDFFQSQDAEYRAEPPEFVYKKRTQNPITEIARCSLHNNSLQKQSSGTTSPAAGTALPPSAALYSFKSRLLLPVVAKSYGNTL